MVVIGLGSESDSDNWVGVPDLQAVMAVILFGGAMVGLVMLVWIVISSESGERTQQPRKNWFVSGILLVIFVVIVLRELDRGESETQDVATAPDISAPASETLPRTVDIADVAGPMIVLITIVALIAWARYRRTSWVSAATDNDEEPGPDALTDMVSAAQRQLETGGDPRSAVLSAYATVEARFEVRGDGRRVAETAEEHVRRVLASNAVTNPDPLLRLAGLYEIARFSEHAITHADQRRAASDLERMKRQLSAERSP